jgi:CrcB protein
MGLAATVLMTDGLYRNTSPVEAFLLAVFRRFVTNRFRLNRLLQMIRSALHLGKTRLGRGRMTEFIIISLGAIIGANLRYWVGDWAAGRFGASFPYGNLIINLSGSLVLGLFIALITGRFIVDPYWRLFVAIGILGSYTTFSSYTFESVYLLLSGQPLLGLLNLFGSSFLGAIAAYLGIYLGRLI